MKRLTQRIADDATTRQPLIPSSLFIALPLKLSREQLLQNHNFSLQLLNLCFFSAQR